MRRGTTPLHTFTLPLDLNNVTDLRIIYKQGNDIVLKKTFDECVVEANVVKVRLSREDTWKFDSRKIVNIQLEIWAPGENGQIDTYVSEEIVKSVAECLDDEV